MKAINECYLYGILDGDYVDQNQACDVVNKMIVGGIDILQLRAKNWSREDITELGKEIHALTYESAIPLIINDYPDIALAIEAEGVHVGQDDPAVHEVREIVGSEMLVGLSTHSLEQAKQSSSQNVNYIGFGPLFSTPTKPDYPAIGTHEIEQVHQELPDFPIFCIGGIKNENLPQVIAAGAHRAVVVSGILQSENITKYTKSLKSLL